MNGVYLVFSSQSTRRCTAFNQVRHRQQTLNAACGHDGSEFGFGFVGQGTARLTIFGAPLCSEPSDVRVVRCQHECGDGDHAAEDLLNGRQRVISPKAIYTPST